MSEYEFVERFLRNGIHTYNKEGETVSPQEIYLQTEDNRDFRKKIIDWRKVEIPKSESESKKMLSKLQDLYFDANNIQSFENEYKLKKERKKTPVQIHKDKVQKAVPKLIEKYPNKYKTIESFVDDQKIIKICDGKEYVRKTIREWVSPVFPNAKRGRPTKKNR
jgi:uncharacterized protein YdiU (UPF0061 family)